MRLATLVTLAIALASSMAHAQSSGAEDPPFMHEPVKATRRLGFTFGLTLGPSLVWTHATPTAYAERNDAYRVSVGPAVAPSITPFIGVALADEVSFTLAVEPVRVSSDDVRVRGTAAQFRIEIFPLASYGGFWRDLAIAPRFGLGSSHFTQASTGDAIASSGTYSLVGADVFWDGLRSARLGLGPMIGVTHRFSDTMTETDLTVGVRVAYYGGP